ncbi:MAG: SMI1/KNR4 family protein [Candidatus Eisenbacteria bacterium]
MAFPTELSFIESEEAKLGVRLPADLRARLLGNNGGEIATDDEDWSLFPVFDASDRKKAARSANHIARETQAAREWRGFPPSAVAIARNGSGDYLVLLPSVDKPGALDKKIYLWAHETGSLTVMAEAIGEL